MVSWQHVFIFCKNTFLSNKWFTVICSLLDNVWLQSRCSYIIEVHFYSTWNEPLQGTASWHRGGEPDLHALAAMQRSHTASNLRLLLHSWKERRLGMADSFSFTEGSQSAWNWGLESALCKGTHVTPSPIPIEEIEDLQSYIGRQDLAQCILWGLG